MPKSHAQTLLDKAEKKANSSSGWFSSSATKFEEAGDLYQQAANAFKIENQFREAGDSFAREAECREKCNESLEASNAWWNAAKAYKKGHSDLAIQALMQTITHLTKAGRFRQAADREKEIGQIYLQELHDLRKACESFERAAEWYANEDASATANACYKDAADLHAELEEYQHAVVLYERVANSSLSSALTKYSVKEYWLKSTMCSLANCDPITAERNFKKYSIQDVTFPSTREAKFAQALIDAVKAGDREAFGVVVFEYDQVSRLDNWKTTILLKVKKSIEDEPGLT